MTSKESRRDPRSRALNLTVRYKSATVADFVEDHSYDISRGGLFIKTANPFATGTLLKFEVRIEGEKTVIDGVGRVAWRREKSLGLNKPAGMGIKFIRIDDASVNLIQQAVAKHQSADSQFEEGAREQGVVLSEPPANLRGEGAQAQPDAPAQHTTEAQNTNTPMFPAPSASDTVEDPSEQSMLFQTSELLKSALNKVNPDASVEASGAEASAGKSKVASGAKDTEIRDADAHSFDDVTAEDRATLPTGSSKIPPRTVNVTPATPARVDDEDEDESEDDDEGDDGDLVGETADDGSSDPPPGVSDAAGDRRRSKRPGAHKRKNPKKKKRKFNYGSLPAPKTHHATLSTTPPADASSSTSPARHRSEFPGTTPAEPATTTSSFWWIATLALIAISGALYLAFSSPEPKLSSDKPHAQPTPAPEPTTIEPSIAEAVPSEAPASELAAAATSEADSTSFGSGSLGTASHGGDSTATGSGASVNSTSDATSQTGEPLSGVGASSRSVDESPDEVEADEPRTTTRKKRPRRKAKSEPEPTASAPATVNPQAPVAPSAPTVSAPVVSPPSAPTAQAPSAPQAPAVPTAPQAPVVVTPVTPQAPTAPSAVPPSASPTPDVRQAPSAQTPAPVPTTQTPAPTTGAKTTAPAPGAPTP